MNKRISWTWRLVLMALPVYLLWHVMVGPSRWVGRAVVDYMGR